MLKRTLAILALIALTGCAGAPPPDTASAGGAGLGQNGVSANGLGAGAQAGRAAPGTEADLQQNVGDRVFFDTDQVEPKPEGRQILQRQAEWLQRYRQVVVTVEGHADERGTREYNLALGERRAQSVKKILIALGVAADRITTITYGKERPAVEGSNEAAWAQNRRAVTVVQ